MVFDRSKYEVRSKGVKDEEHGPKRDYTGETTFRRALEIRLIGVHRVSTGSIKQVPQKILYRSYLT